MDAGATSCIGQVSRDSERRESKDAPKDERRNSYQPTCQTSDGKPDKLGAHNDHPLVLEHQSAQTKSRRREHTDKIVLLAIIDPLNSDDIRLQWIIHQSHIVLVKDIAYRIGRRSTDASHDRNQDMLLDSERSRIERNTKYLDLGHEPRPEATSGEC